MSSKPDGYRPPESKDELLRRYANGERDFPGTELDDTDFVGAVLDGANFGSFSWFSSANFDGASLRGTSFRECNLKCATFRNADLTGASFELASIESISLEGAILKDIKFVGATSYGYTLKEGDQFP